MSSLRREVCKERVVVSAEDGKSLRTYVEGLNTSLQVLAMGLAAFHISSSSREFVAQRGTSKQLQAGSL